MTPLKRLVRATVPDRVLNAVLDFIDDYLPKGSIDTTTFLSLLAAISAMGLHRNKAGSTSETPSDLAFCFTVVFLTTRLDRRTGISGARLSVLRGCMHKLGLVQSFPWNHVSYVNGVMLKRARHYETVGRAVFSEITDSLDENSFTYGFLAYAECRYFAFRRTNWRKQNGIVVSEKLITIPADDTVMIEFPLDRPFYTFSQQSCAVIFGIGVSGSAHFSHLKMSSSIKANREKISRFTSGFQFAQCFLIVDDAYFDESEVRYVNDEILHCPQLSYHLKDRHVMYSVRCRVDRLQRVQIDYVAQNPVNEEFPYGTANIMPFKGVGEPMLFTTMDSPKSEHYFG